MTPTEADAPTRGARLASTRATVRRPGGVDDRAQRRRRARAQRHQRPRDRCVRHRRCSRWPSSIYRGAWGAVRHPSARRRRASDPAAVAARRRRPGTLPPEPRLTDQRAGRRCEQLRAPRRDARRYGWVDQTTGIARIPIEEAMKLLLQRGLPARRRDRRSRRRHARAGFGEANGGRTIACGARTVSRWATLVSWSLRRRSHGRTTEIGSRAAVSRMRVSEQGSRSALVAAFLRRAWPRRLAAQVRVRQAAEPAAAKPGLLQRDRHRPAARRAGAARPAVPRRDRPGRAARRLLRQAAGRPRARLLRVPDALHAGAERRRRSALRVAERSTPAASSTSSRSASTRTKARRWRAQKKAAYLERYKRAGARGGLALPDRHDDSRSSALTAGVGFRYAYDDRDAASSRTARASMVLTPKGSCRATSTASSTRRATCGSRWSRRRTSRIGTLDRPGAALCYHYDPATGKYGAMAIDGDPHRRRADRAGARRRS